jgi:hypothetical protein
MYVSKDVRIVFFSSSFFPEARRGLQAEMFGQHGRKVLNVSLCLLGQYHEKHNDLFFLLHLFEFNIHD